MHFFDAVVAIARRLPSSASPARARSMQWNLDPDDIFAARAAEAGARERDRVECEVYVLDESITESRADALLLALNAEIARLSAWHVWQRDAFALERAARGSSRAVFRGCVEFGDCVDDAWFAAHLARALSATFADAIAVRVWDDDGEFLLIETAEALPGWVTPERAHGCTFLYKGRLVVVDGDELASNESSVRTREAVGKVASAAPLSDEVQRVLNARLDAFPARALENRHDAYAWTPRRVGEALRREPQLVALAVESFRTRDPVGLRAASKMHVFAPVDIEPTLCRMSRCLFAQATRERFDAPKCYPMPPKSSEFYAAHELGMKIACGLEMLVAEWERQGHDMSGAASTACAMDAEASSAATGGAAEPAGDAAWDTFKASLTANGYFRNEMVGSALYKSLLAHAVSEFKGFSHASRARRLRNAPAERLREILAAPLDEHYVPRAVNPNDASDDSWLHNAEMELNAELAKLEKEREGTIRDATQSASAFVHRESGYEGVDATKTNHNAKDGSCPGDLNISDDDGVFNLDASAFLAELSKALGVDDDEKFKRYMRSADASGLTDSDDDFDDDDSSDDAPPSDDFFSSSSDAEEEYLQFTRPTKAPEPESRRRKFIHVDESESDSDDADDSDDENHSHDEDFDAQYDSVLREQLTGTHIHASRQPLEDADVDAALARGILDASHAAEGAPNPAQSLLTAAGVDPSRIRDVSRITPSE